MTTDTPDAVAAFFDRYQQALLARDEQAVATMYAVPALILAPGQSVPVTSQQQTAEFFAGSWGQYDGVEQLDHRLEVVLQGPQTVWADVTWSGDGAPTEHFCYQLVQGEHGYQIAVLTMLDPTA